MKIKTDCLPINLKKEWEGEISFYRNISREQRWKEFNDIYQQDDKDIKEIINLRPNTHREWLHWKYNINNMKCDVKKNWCNFKEYWQFYSPETDIVFEEMEKLSCELIGEWRMKYNNISPHVYGYKENKSMYQLWQEFKEIWQLDMQNYNEDRYEMMVKILQLSNETNQDDWHEFLTQSNYHSYDCYSIIEQYKIWNEYLDL